MRPLTASSIATSSSDTDVGELDLEVDERVDVLLGRRLIGAHRPGHVHGELAVDVEQSVVATFQVVVAVRHRHLRLLVQLETTADRHTTLSDGGSFMLTNEVGARRYPGKILLY